MTNDQNDVLSWLDTQATSMRALTEELCNINSYTENTSGIDAVRAVLKSQYNSFAETVQEVPLPHHEIVQTNGEKIQLPIASALQVVQRPTAAKRVFLCIHMDTVYPPESPFQKCEEIRPGILNGPGVIDAKGGAVVMLYALQAFERFPESQNLGWEVVLNTDEEIGSPSSQSFVKERGQQSQLGLLFEPAMPDGTLVDQRKGSGNYSIIIRGKSVHSGRDFENGRNAIVLGSEVAARLHDWNQVHDEVTINVARMDGGGPLNVVPDLGIVRVNVRVANQEQQAWFEKQLEELVHDCDAREGFLCELHGGFFSPPKELDPGSRKLKENIEDSANSLGMDIGWRSTGGVSDGNKLSAVNLPNIDTLGARGDNMHSVDEYLVIDSLVERAKLVTLILMRYAAGEYTVG